MEKHLIKLQKIATLPKEKPKVQHSCFTVIDDSLISIFFLGSSPHQNLQPFDNSESIGIHYFNKTLLVSAFDMVYSKSIAKEVSWFGSYLKGMQISDINIHRGTAHFLMRGGDILMASVQLLMQDTELFENKLEEFYQYRINTTSEKKSYIDGLKGLIFRTQAEAVPAVLKLY